MIYRFCIFILFTVITVTSFAQQKPLPAIEVKNIGSKIIVSWVNDYTKPIATLNIQRSYDSLKNFSTIGSVLSPQSKENGFADANAPYSKMYYRVFVAFEGGSYVTTNSVKPLKDTSTISSNIIYPWMRGAAINVDITGKPTNTTSNYIYTAKDNSVIIHLPDFANKKYNVKFYNDTENFLFELTKLNEEYLIVEKVNFVKSGWFKFEIFENGRLIETNRFQILKDVIKKIKD